MRWEQSVVEFQKTAVLVCGMCSYEEPILIREGLDGGERRARIILNFEGDAMALFEKYLKQSRIDETSIVDDMRIVLELFAEGKLKA